MINLVTDSEIRCYYTLTSEQRRAWFEEIVTSHEGWPLPHSLLSIFEVCLAYSLMMRDDNLTITAPFAGCWNEFADFQHQYSSPGCYLTLLEFFDEEIEFYRILQEIPVYAGTDRGTLQDHFPMTRRLREVCQKTLVALDPYSNSCWKVFGKYQEQCPSRLPEQWEPRGDGSVIIDNNSLINLLEQLDPQGRWPISLETCGSSLNATARQYCQSLLNDCWRTNKIVIPICVLEECHRVAAREEKRHVLQVLESMIESEEPFWASFEFEPFSLEVLKSYLDVRERCLQLKLADAIVVAHAVKNQLPVISGDTEVQAAATQFPFLVLN
jgi:predicted nucleic acid-binding protein